MAHSEASPLAGKTVAIKASVARAGGLEFRVEDWWDRVSGKSWKVSLAEGNPACCAYAARPTPDVPHDDEVLYGKIGPFGHLIHVSEIEPAAEAQAEG